MSKAAGRPHKGAGHEANGAAAAVWVDPGVLKPWAKNPRKNDGKPVDEVAKSIERFGFAAPIIANKDGEVIAGHTRLKAAKKLGLTSVPVRYVDLPEKEAHALAVADNKLGELAEWDDDLLRAAIDEVEDVSGLGFDERSLARLIDEGRPPAESGDVVIGRPHALQKKWGTVLGQRWRIPSRNAKGEHVLVCGDSGDSNVVARLMGTERAHMMWTDPPYGVVYIGKTKDALTIENDDLKGDSLREFLVRCFSVATTAALIEGAAVYVAHPPGGLLIEFALAFRDVTWRLHQTLVWNKGTIVLGHSDYHYAHEPILFGYTPGGGRRGRGGVGWYGDDAQRSVFDVAKPQANEDHPTMKPIDLVAIMVRNSAPLGGLVYEPFNGSGTTLLAAETTGRIGRGIELDPKYVAVALERLTQIGLEPKLDTV